MAEVTREMILDYMQAKGGVVKNVDLVRHFRKFLQVSDARVKDQARERFKARVNEVAYIKADNKGEKYLYLKPEFGQAPTGSVAPSNRDSAHSILSNRDSTHSVLSKRDSAHSVLSKRDSTHSAYSKRDSAHSILSSNSSDNSGHNYGRGSGHQPPSGRDSGRQVSGHGSSLSSTSRRTPPTDSPGHSSRSARASGHVNSTGYSSGQGPSSLGQPTSTTGHSSGQGSKLSSVREPPPPSSSSSGATTSLLGDSLLGDSLLGDTAFSSFLSGGSGLGSGLGSGVGAAAPSTRGGSSTSNTTTTGGGGGGGGGGGDSSFASDIFGSIGSFWGDSGTTAAGGSSAFSGDQKKPSSSVATSSALSSSSSGSRSSTQHTSSTAASSYSRESKSQVAGGISSDVTLQSYKPNTSAAAPPTSAITSSAAPSRSSHVPPSPPPPSQSTRPPSPPPGSSSPAAPAPPRRNLSYTSTYTGSTSGGSAFSPPPPQSSSPGDGSTLLAQMTSELSSLGELGSLLDSFGDFSMDKPASTSVASDPYTSKTTTSLSNSTDQLLTSSSYSSNLSDRSSKITSSSNSSDRSGRTVMASEKAEPKQVPPQPPTRQSPAKTSPVTTNTSAFTTVHSRPPPPTSAPPSGSPMRVPRRTVGAPMDPPPPPPSSQSPLAQGQGSFNGGHQQPETSPQINIQRVDSPRSDSSSNGVVSPLAGSNSSVSGDAGTLKGRSGGSGLPPLPPSAMLGAPDSRRLTVTAANGGVGVALRQHDKASRDRIQSSLRRSRNLEKNANLDTLTRASIMMTPPSVRRSMQAPGPGGAMFARPAPDSREDLSQYQGEGGDQDGSLSAPSEEYEEIDPLEKEWMLACASADLQDLHTLIIRDSTLINRRDFLHGYTALHWAAKLGRCDFMSILVLNGAFVDIKSNGGFTPLHLACQGGYDNAIAMLIRDHRANVNTRDNSGRKPVDMLNCACSENIRGLLTSKLTGSKAVHHSSEHLPSFSQPRTRLGSLTSMWASMPNALECSDEKQKKRVSPRNVRKTFSFRSRNKLHSPPKEKDKKNDRPKSHIPTSGDSYDV